MFELSFANVRLIEDNILIIESEPEAASNSGIIVGDDIIGIVDTRLTPALGKELRKYVDELVSQPTKIVVVNTHHHGDHWFGNEAFCDQTIVSSEWARQALTQNWQEQVTRFCDIRPHQGTEFKGVSPALPTLGVSNAVTVDLGSRKMDLMCVGPAHTPGDMVVSANGGRTIFAGDLITNGHWPVFWDADFTGWLHALDTLAKTNVDTVIPGHGSAGSEELITNMTRCLFFLDELSCIDQARWEDSISASMFSNWLYPERILPAVSKIREQTGSS